MLVINTHMTKGSCSSLVVLKMIWNLEQCFRFTITWCQIIMVIYWSSESKREPGNVPMIEAKVNSLSVVGRKFLRAQLRTFGFWLELSREIVPDLQFSATEINFHLFCVLFQCILLFMRPPCPKPACLLLLLLLPLSAHHLFVKMSDWTWTPLGVLLFLSTSIFMNSWPMRRLEFLLNWDAPPS